MNNNNQNQSRNNQQQNQNQQNKAPESTPSAVVSTLDTGGTPPVQVEVKRLEVTQPTKMVKIKPRESIARFRFGQDWYSLEKNKETLVPDFVAKHLEEKNII